MKDLDKAGASGQRRSSHLIPGILAGLAVLCATQPANASTTSRFVLDTVPYSSSMSLTPLAVASNDAGDFATAWSGPDGIKLQVFSANGTAKGPAITIPSPYGPNFFSFSGQLAMNDNGQIAAVWEQGTWADSTHMTWTVMSQRFDATGAPVGSTNTILTETDQFGTQALFYNYWYINIEGVAMNAAGDLALAWSRYKEYDTCLSAGSSPTGCNGEILPANASESMYAMVEKAAGTNVGPVQIDSVHFGAVPLITFDTILALTIGSNDSLTVLYGQEAAAMVNGAFTRHYSPRLIATTGKVQLAVPAGAFTTYPAELTPANGGLDSSGNAYLMLESYATIQDATVTASPVYKFDTAGALTGSASQIPAGAVNLAVSASGAFAVSGVTYTNPPNNGLATLTAQPFDSNLAPIGTPLTLDSGFILPYELQPNPLVSMNGNGNLVEIAGELGAALDSYSLVALTVQQ